ncbi:hypothetical protein MTO96_041061 [Rhipicephalus appendiculatus]
MNAKHMLCCILRYKKEWIYDCLLLKVKSTAVYNFLHENGFLPLPNPRTLYGYLRSLKADFGFDASLFAVLREKLQGVPERERRGVLMFDEMSVRKSVHIRESDMSLLGKVDFSEHTRPADREKDGDHVLVFLFRPFLGGWSQTVGSFCACGAAPGSIVAKLLLQCIVHLTNAGVVVDAITCDNSTTNQSALKSLGISGDINSTKNKFPHPSLRITLHSTVALVESLLSSGFRYVLVGNFGQDPLEVDTLAVLFDDVLMEPPGSVEDTSGSSQVLSPKECILDYLAGYVTKKFSSISCLSCVETLKGLSRQASDLIAAKSSGFLQVPSCRLLSLLQIVESHVEELTLLGAVICGWVHDVGLRVGDVSCSREILPSDVVWSVPVPADDLLQCTGELHYSNFSSGCIAGLLAVENCRASTCTDSGYMDSPMPVTVPADHPLYHHACAPTTFLLGLHCATATMSTQIAAELKPGTWDTVDSGHGRAARMKFLRNYSSRRQPMGTDYVLFRKAWDIELVCDLV